MPERLPLYLNFPEGEVKEFDGTTDTVDMDASPQTRLYPYTANGTETDVFIVAGLDLKRILGVVRAGMFKRIILGTPTDDETIGITGTDVGDNKGILSDGGEIKLNTGDALINLEKIDFIYYE